MLGFREEEAVVAVVALVVGGIIAFKLIRAYHQRQTSKLRLIELALQQPQLDPATRTELLHQIHDPGIIGNWLKPRTLAAFGWLGMFVGIGCMISGDRSAEEAGPIIALMSFGVLSLPFALRELDLRRHPRKSES